jgi:hypothetical protein
MRGLRWLRAASQGADVGDCNAVPAARPDGPVVVGEVHQRVAERVGNGFLARVSDGQCCPLQRKRALRYFVAD